MFVRWDCGCLGLKLDNRNIVIEPCDLNYDELGSLSFDHREMENDSEPLTEEEIKRFMRSISTMLWDGFKLRQIKDLIKD